MRRPRRAASSKARQHVRRVAARREADGDVELAGVGDELPREDELEADIVGERGEDGLVVDQRQGGQRVPVRGVAEQVRRPLRIGRAATVAEAEQPSTARRSAPPWRPRRAPPVAAQRSSVSARREADSSILARADMTRSVTRAPASRSSASMKG